MDKRTIQMADLAAGFVRECCLCGFTQEEMAHFVDTAWKVLTSEREPAPSASGEQK